MHRIHSYPPQRQISLMDETFDSEDEIDVISVGEESSHDELVQSRKQFNLTLESNNKTKKLGLSSPRPSISSVPSSELSSPMSGSAGSVCYSPPMKQPSPSLHVEREPNFKPHPALILPNVLPFLASRHHEEAMMSLMMRQKFLNSYAAMSSLMGPQVPSPFLLPFMNQPMRVPQPPPMRPVMNNVPKSRMFPAAPPLQLMHHKEPQTAPFSGPKPSAEKIETVNGGFGIKNPLAKNPAIQDHLLQTMVEKGEDNFLCKVCKKRFPLQRLLNRHVKCHSTIKRYLCTFCGKGFNDTFDLKRHTRTHTGVRPYKCGLCNKAFTQRCSLESHCKKVHNEEYDYQFKQRRSKLYVCEQCGSVNDDPEKHFLHLKDFHPGSPALQKCYDKRQFKFSKEQLPRILQHQTSTEK